MEVYMIHMMGDLDNLCYYITRDLHNQPGVMIDVAEPAKMQTFFQRMGITVDPGMILTTHKHYDHCQGNLEMKAAFPNIRIHGSSLDNIPGNTGGLQHGQVIEFAQMRITAIHTPCHTPGSMCFYFEPIEGAQEGLQHTTEKVNGYQVTKNVNRMVFTGDTIFNGGCGFFFEGGTPQQMVRAMQIARDELPGDTKVYGGHEVALGNMKFARQVDPSNQVIAAKQKQFQTLRNQGTFTVPTTLNEEKLHNVFMRSLDADMQ